ncbi:ATP-binding protein [Acetobacter conturbans]|uniref:histidine kinase n=1 Tax=Acetobacter conturbans TaxID=1737472 RepID=A0ABX0K247_9PROT|nr:ATP-binding protein [Acetobacter conturbans]NHN88310.1 HAMP domain-containing protein [Acetobacter conturbans]
MTDTEKPDRGESDLIAEAATAPSGGVSSPVSHAFQRVRQATRDSLTSWRHARLLPPAGNPQKRLISPLMRRILLVNILPLAVFGLTLLFLNQFRNTLLASEVSALREQARIYAGALGQSAVTLNPAAKSRHDRNLPGGAYILESGLTRPLLLKLTEPSPRADARVYSPDGQLIADSHQEKLAHHIANAPPLPPDVQDTPIATGPGRSENRRGIFRLLLDSLVGGVDDSPLRDDGHPHGGNHPNAPDFTPEDVETPPYIRRTPDHTLVITIAEPVIHDGQTVGVLQLTRTGEGIDISLFKIRTSILSLFLLAMAIMVLLSWYLSLTIARPLLRLAASALVMRESSGRAGTVPSSLLGRSDEIGDVARALQDSAQALWTRMDAIERFAADVSHEIKNPLTSIRSAIETLLRTNVEEKQQRLLTIIGQDVQRLDRLITDISDASRLDAELSRAHVTPVAVGPLLAFLAEIHQSIRKADQPVISVSISDDVSDHPLLALAVEDRLVQVLRNLIGNAISFSPPQGKILLEAHAAGSYVALAVSDEGPGIPAAKLDSIFDRFYSERPKTEHFGQHSGLGLSISRQIIQALHGTIRAENKVDASGQVCGARFIIHLPRAESAATVGRETRKGELAAP